MLLRLGLSYGSCKKSSKRNSVQQFALAITCSSLLQTVRTEPVSAEMLGARTPEKHLIELGIMKSVLGFNPYIIIPESFRSLYCYIVGQGDDMDLSTFIHTIAGIDDADSLISALSGVSLLLEELEIRYQHARDSGNELNDLISLLQSFNGDREAIKLFEEVSSENIGRIISILLGGGSISLSSIIPQLLNIQSLS